MAETIGELHYNGVFDFTGLQRMINAWLVERGYDVLEKAIKVKGGSPGGEYEWLIAGSRNHTEYVQFKTTVTIRAFDLQDVDIVRDGKKLKMQKGRFILTVVSEYSKDYNKIFDTPFHAKLKKFMDKYIIGLEEGFFWWDAMYYEGYRLYSSIKSYLNMETAFNAY